MFIYLVLCRGDHGKLKMDMTVFLRGTRRGEICSKEGNYTVTVM